MPLIPYGDPEALPEKARKSFNDAPKLNIFRMLANAPTLFRPVMALGHAILTKQKLAGDLRELVILAAARLDNGAYEYAQHVSIAEQAGCTKEQIAAIDALQFDAPCFDARTCAMLRLLRETKSDARASKETLDAAKAHFSPQEIVEILLTRGYYAMLARMTETLEVDVDVAKSFPPDFAKLR